MLSHFSTSNSGAFCHRQELAQSRPDALPDSMKTFYFKQDKAVWRIGLHINIILLHDDMIVAVLSL